MLTLSDLFAAQRRYGASSDVSETEHISYEMYLASCRRALADKTMLEYYNWDLQRQREFTDNLIIQFVRTNNKDVEGFLTDDGVTDLDALINRLRSDITDFGVLKESLEDPEIQEIDINDFRTIYVVKAGKTMPYVDSRGKPYQFVSDSELHATINRMIYNPNGDSPRMTATNPLLNARASFKGYRVSAVNNTAITRDMTEGFDFPITSVTIRKYSQNYWKFSDYVANNTMSAKMADFLRLVARSHVRLACVGKTSSGKTTLLWTIVNELAKPMRKICIQNPTEITGYDRNPETGFNRNNILLWQASEVSAEAARDSTTPTMSNMIQHALRNSPDILILGEIRASDEFYQFVRAALTGHRACTSFHAEDADDAMNRIALELNDRGGNIVDNKRIAVSVLDIIVTQDRLDDGSRHVMSIDEITGKILPDGTAETITLFEYVLEGTNEYDDNGIVTKINGHFEQKNSISDRLKKKFFKAGVSLTEIEPFLNVDNSDSYKLQDDSDSTPVFKVIPDVLYDGKFMVNKADLADAVAAEISREINEKSEKNTELDNPFISSDAFDTFDNDFLNSLDGDNNNS